MLHVATRYAAGIVTNVTYGLADKFLINSFMSFPSEIRIRQKAVTSQVLNGGLLSMNFDTLRYFLRKYEYSVVHFH